MQIENRPGVTTATHTGPLATQALPATTGAMGFSSALTQARQAVEGAASPGSGAAATFAAAYSAAVGSVSGSGSVMLTAKEKTERIQQSNEAVLAEFREYMDKTPAQRMRDAILREMGLTEEDLDAMPPEKREAVEAEIGERLRERILGQVDDSLKQQAASRDAKADVAAVGAGAAAARDEDKPW